MVSVFLKNFINLDESEKKLILNWRNSEVIRNNMFNNQIIEINNHINWLNNLKKNEHNKYYLVFFDEIPKGVVYYNNLDFINKKGEWGFYLGEKFKGGGIITEYLAIENFFRNLKMNRLQCYVFDFNEPIIKLHKDKFFFKEEGILRNYIMRNDKFMNVIVLSLLKNEWLDIQNQVRLRIEKIISIENVLWE